MAPAVSHLLQPGHIHRGEPRQRLQVPREVLLPQLGGVCGQKPSREKRKEGEGVEEMKGGERELSRGVNTAVSSNTRNLAGKFKGKHLRENLVLQSQSPLLK